MYRFNNVACDPESGTANVGTGLVWDDVYAALAPYNVSVLGARVSGVGVGGFVLGGGKSTASSARVVALMGLVIVGYSWKTNQYGLAVDSITQYELVKPDGSVVTVTEASDSELFFGLKVIRFTHSSCLTCSQWHI